MDSLLLSVLVVAVEFPSFAGDFELASSIDKDGPPMSESLSAGATKPIALCSRTLL
jgi:hypothetical protein